MIIGWCISLVVALLLLWSLKTARKWLIRLLTACLIASIAYVFYASASYNEPASGNSNPPAIDGMLYDDVFEGDL
ncbi:hypothetical protein H4Q31_06950 [Cohnella lubricantis]|uniref:Uncharacterized protein n=1 Tax=Cohnella lubricantis TaxID=2163172 RepID=A0A841TAH0_9BACL|nr:hypothetical protein [Cohnella lubricantis]